MKLLPLLILGLQKSALLKGAREVNTDDRANVLFQLMMMPLESVMTLLYPKCYPLLDLSMVQLQAAEGAGAGGGQGAGGAGSGGPCLVPGSLPPTLPLTLNSIRDKGIYLFDNGLEMYIWIGRQISPKWLVDVFGVGENPSPPGLACLGRAFRRRAEECYVSKGVCDCDAPEKPVTLPPKLHGGEARRPDGGADSSVARRGQRPVRLLVHQLPGIHTQVLPHAYKLK